MSATWKYLQGRKVKHYFTSSRKVSLCGVNIVWYSPEEWQNDKEGLAKIRQCKNCTRLKDKQ